MTDLRAKYGEYALVTGASSGIGAEFAEQLAAAGFSLVLVARRKDRLEALAGRLRAAYRTATEVIELDLGAEGAVAELARRTASLDVGLVVASAGVVTSGPFLGNDLAAEEELLRLNLLVPAQLAHVYGRLLASRGHGGLILVSSAVAFAPAPYTANYAAAKAYVASLGQALGYELKGSGRRRARPRARPGPHRGCRQRPRHRLRQAAGAVHAARSGRAGGAAQPEPPAAGHPRRGQQGQRLRRQVPHPAAGTDGPVRRPRQPCP